MGSTSSGYLDIPNRACTCSTLTRTSPTLTRSFWTCLTGPTSTREARRTSSTRCLPTSETSTSEAFVTSPGLPDALLPEISPSETFARWSSTLTLNFGTFSKTLRNMTFSKGQKPKLTPFTQTLRPSQLHHWQTDLYIYQVHKNVLVKLISSTCL